jgi:hypothetical protein
MSNAQDDAASEAGRLLARARWGSQAVDRAAELVISRAGELDDSLRAELHEITGPPGGEGHGDG